MIGEKVGIDFMKKIGMFRCVRWWWCWKCEKVVDEFEAKCGWCGAEIYK